MSSWKVTTGPASEPVTRSEAKLWLKVDTTADDALIDALIESARVWVERHCNIGLLPQTITEVYDSWPEGREFDLTITPLREVSAVTYIDSNGSQQTLSSSNYIVDSYQRPARVQLKYSQIWPTLYDQMNSVSAIYTVGYDAASAVPGPVITAMKLAIADAYENRQDSIKRMPTAAEYLLQSSGERIWQFK